MTTTFGGGGNITSDQFGCWFLELPLDVPLSLNDRQHHMVKARAVSEVRNTMFLLIRAAKIPPCERIRVTMTYIPKVKRRRDPDNLVATYKPVLDAFVAAGVVPDDTEEYVVRVWPRFASPNAKWPGARFQVKVERLV